jgi:hypothetical protein
LIAPIDDDGVILWPTNSSPRRRPVVRGNPASEFASLSMRLRVGIIIGMLGFAALCILIGRGSDYLTLALAFLVGVPLLSFTVRHFARR